MEKTMLMPAYYNVLNTEEMTYTEGGANATATQAICAWFVPFYGWYKGCQAVRDYRRAHPNTWLDTGLDALTSHMEKSLTNMIYDIGCAGQVLTVCAASGGIGLIPTALLIFS